MLRGECFVFGIADLYRRGLAELIGLWGRDDVARCERGVRMPEFETMLS